MATKLEAMPTTAPLNQDIVDHAVKSANVTALGKGIEVISERRITLNEKTADEFLSLTPFESERRLGSGWVATLKTAMLRHTFRPEQVKLSTAFCDALGDSEIRLNGQHTCHAVKAAKMSYQVTKVLYRCKTMYDLRQLYASLDRGRPRTASHVAMSYLDGSPLGQFGRYITPLLLSGLTTHLYLGKTEASKHDTDERCYLLLSAHEKLAMKIGKFMQAHQTPAERRYFRKSTVGAMYATFETAPRDATEFWTQVVTGAEVKRNSPILQLQPYLLKLRKATGRLKDRLMATDEEVYRACIMTWNAWRSGKPIQSFRPHLLKSRPAVL